MWLLKYLIIYFFTNEAVQSLRLECEFGVYLGGEGCRVDTLKVLENDVTITAISKTRTSMIKTNDDVKVIWINKVVETERVPTDICNFFKNLERFEVQGSSILRINRQVFRNCKKVSVVLVVHTSLTTLPEDVFEDLSELWQLLLHDNKLVALPPDLIAKNTKLKMLLVRNNRLSNIDTDITSTLTLIDLSGNDCINKKFPEDIADLNLFTNEVISKCESPTKKSYRSKLIALNKTLSEKILKLEQKKENEKAVLVTNITQMVSTIESMKMSDKSFKNEIEALKMNNIQNLAKLFEENNILRLNNSNLEITLTDKLENFKELSRKNKELNANLVGSNQNIKVLQENLSKLEAVIKVMRANEIILNSSLEECSRNRLNDFKINEEVKEKKKVLENENGVLASNITQLMSTIERFKIAYDELKIEKHDINQKLEEHLVSSNQNNTFLKGNLTKIEAVIEVMEVKLNATLEECWQNQSAKDEINENLSAKLNELQNLTILSSPDNIEEISENCSHMIHYVYFIILAVTFALILITTVIVLRRDAATYSLKEQMASEVNMENLNENEQNF